MKRQSNSLRTPGKAAKPEAEELAIAVLGRIAADPERLGRFLTVTGLDAGSIRDAAAEPGFLAAILDHAAADEALLVTLAGELDVSPERLAAARQVLSPEAGWEP